jgi:hypothetical protein
MMRQVHQVSGLITRGSWLKVKTNDRATLLGVHGLARLKKNQLYSHTQIVTRRNSIEETLIIVPVAREREKNERGVRF